MKPFFILSIFLVYAMTAFQQTYLDIEDSMVIPSYSYIIINAGNDGLIRIKNKENILIDGDGVMVDSRNYQGYMVKTNNSSYIQIKNFDGVKHYKFADYITNSSDHIDLPTNPADSFFTVKGDFSPVEPILVRIFNGKGKMENHFWKKGTNGRKVIVELHELNNRIYFIELFVNRERVATEKFVVSHYIG